MKNAPLFIKVDVSGGICKRFVGRESVKKHFGSFLFFAVFWVVEVSIITKLPPSSYKPAPVLQLRHMVKQNFRRTQVLLSISWHDRKGRSIICFIEQNGLSRLFFIACSSCSTFCGLPLWLFGEIPTLIHSVWPIAKLQWLQSSS